MNKPDVSTSKSTIASQIRSIQNDFEAFPDWEARYAHIIAKGKSLVVMPAEQKSEANIVRGCQSQVWLAAELVSGGRICFRGDSDALLVRGAPRVDSRGFSTALARGDLGDEFTVFK